MRQKLLKAKNNKITRKKGVGEETGIVLYQTSLTLFAQVSHV